LTGAGPLPLHRLPLAVRGRVVGLQAEGHVRRRLLDLGFVVGTRVTPLRRSPLGDPTAYGVRGTVIALRQADADGILVTPEP